MIELYFNDANLLPENREEVATEEFGNYMDVNFPNVTFKPEFVNPRAARWCGM